MTNMRSNDKYEVPIRRHLPTEEEPGSKKKIAWWKNVCLLPPRFALAKQNWRPSSNRTWRNAQRYWGDKRPNWKNPTLAIQVNIGDGNWTGFRKGCCWVAATEPHQVVHFLKSGDTFGFSSSSTFNLKFKDTYLVDSCNWKIYRWAERNFKLGAGSIGTICATAVQRSRKEKSFCDVTPPTVTSPTVSQQLPLLRQTIQWSSGFWHFWSSSCKPS